MKKKVAITTLNARQFVKDIVYLAGLGAEFTDDCYAHKGMYLLAEMEVPTSAVVEESHTIKIKASSVRELLDKEKELVKKEVDPNKEYTREELEVLTLKQVKDITGLNYRDKEKMITEYLTK